MGKTTRHSTTRHDAAKLSHGENTKELQREYGWIGGRGYGNKFRLIDHADTDGQRDIHMG